MKKTSRKNEGCLGRSNDNPKIDPSLYDEIIIQ